MSFGIYETVTNRIIAELEAGAIPWTQPWKNQKSGGVMPLNRATGRPYSGINIPILWGAASAFGYPTHQWLTFKQALDMKACSILRQHCNDVPKRRAELAKSIGAGQVTGLGSPT